MNTNIEIERRFLLCNESWRKQVGAPQILQQGYLSVDKACTIRVRIVGEEAWLTIKGYISDMSRSEFEYPIAVNEARLMLETLCPFKLEKHRYTLTYEGFIFEIDEFFGENAPLVIAELELPSEETVFAKPEWLGEEITSHGKFTNAYLSKYPYSTWGREE